MKSIIVHDWMINMLHLSGVALLIFAVYYSFNSFGQKCFVKPETLAKFVGCSRSQVFRALNSLADKEILIYDDSDNSYSVSSSWLADNDEDLEELCRIAKTPWLD